MAMFRPMRTDMQAQIGAMLEEYRAVRSRIEPLQVAAAGRGEFASDATKRRRSPGRGRVRVVMTDHVSSSVEAAIRIDAEALRAIEPRMDALADGVAATLSRLRSALGVEGRCWGDDE